MIELLVDQHEPAELTRLGRVDSHIEPRWGCDFAIVRDGEPELVAQRKAGEDLFKSLNDGRLARQLVLLREVPLPFVVIERYPRWSSTGHLEDWSGYGPHWHQTAWWTALQDIQEAGVGVLQVASLEETVSWLQFQLSLARRR